MIPPRASPFLLFTILLSSLIILSTGLPTVLQFREIACTALGHCPGQFPKPEPLPAKPQYPQLPGGPQHEGTKPPAPHAKIPPRAVPSGGAGDGGKHRTPAPAEPKPIATPKHGHLKKPHEPADPVLGGPAQGTPHAAAPTGPV